MFSGTCQQGFVYLIVLCDHPTLFLYFLPFCYPYILLHFKCFFLLLVYVIFWQQARAWAEVAITAAEVCHRQPLIYGQLTQALATLAVLAEESLTQASFQTLSLMGSCTESTLLWMDNKARSPSLKTGGTHRSRHSKSTSLNHSDIFIFMVGTYLSLSKCLVQLTTQRILRFFDPLPRYTTNWLNF